MSRYLIVIVYKTSLLPKLLETWEDIGVPGVTIMRGAGGYRTRSRLDQIGLRTISELLNLDEVQSKVLLSVIEDEDLLERAIVEAERVIGDFNQPDTGLLFTLPVDRTVGILKPEAKDETAKHAPASQIVESLTETVLAARNTPISVVNEILDLEPVIVQAQQPLLDLVETMIDSPTINVVCVVNEQQRLVGLLPLQNLADDLFLMIMPEEFLSETRDQEGALRYAKLTATRTAGDAMLPAVWVKEDDTLKDAFQKMHDNKLPGIPLVNDHYEVTGYINLLELLAAIYARSQKTSES
jgi:CBS domain-containing protein